MRTTLMALAILSLAALPAFAQAEHPIPAADGSPLIDGCQQVEPMPAEGLPDPIEQAACFLIQGRSCPAGQVAHCSWGGSIGTCTCVNGAFDCGNPP